MVAESWSELVKTFRFVRGSALLRLGVLPRCQALPSDDDVWFEDTDPPLLALFVSHRWETPHAPDPRGRQLAALQALLRKVADAAAAAHAPLTERSAFAASLGLEGSMQALSLALWALGIRRLQSAFIPDEARRRIVREGALELGGQSTDFGTWLLGRIAVWIDYTCVPQSPRSEAEERRFIESIRHLPDLAAACTLVALRAPNDGYRQSGWCTLESYLAGRDAGGRGFGRNMFLDGEAMLQSRELYLPEPPKAADPNVAAVLAEGYEQSRQAFESDLEGVRTSEPPFADVSPPDLWSSYCDFIVQGSHTLENDPNPVRAGLQLTLLLGESLLTSWLQATEPVEIELRQRIERCFATAGLSCSVPTDIVYLGLLLGKRSTLRVFDALLQEALEGHLAAPLEAPAPLRARLWPMPETLRQLINRIERPSAFKLHSLLTSGPTRPGERDVVAALQLELTKHPLVYEIP